MTPLTPLQALVVLVAECELSLDYRRSFRSAMADGWRAIQAQAPARLMDNITLGEPLETADTELTFTELFGKPHLVLSPIAERAQDAFHGPLEPPARAPAIRECACNGGVCMGLIDNGRDATGAHCRAYRQEGAEFFADFEGERHA